MRFVFVGAGGAQDLDVHFESPEPTIGDLISGLTAAGFTFGGEPGLFVNGMFQTAGVDVIDAGLHDGAVVSVGDTTAATGAGRPHAPSPGPHLGVLTGMATGRSLALSTPGVYLVGRAAECHLQLPDPTVSRIHCELHVGDRGPVTVVNRSSADGTRIAGEPITEPTPVTQGLPIRLGAVLVQVDDITTTDRLAGAGRPGWTGPAGTASFNRPPRLVQLPPDTTLVAPEEPEVASKAPFSVATVIAPLALGLVMVLVLKNPLYAMFAILSPVMVVGNWWETRHRTSRAWRGSTREFNRQLAAFTTTVRDARVAETAARRRPVPTPPELLRRATLPSVALWERRRFHADFLHLSLGSEDAIWAPKLAQPSMGHPTGPAALEVLAGHQVLPDVPAVMDLSAGHVVGLVGPRPLALGVARNLMCQAAVLHGPADVRLCVVAPEDSEGVWDWTKWLPHVRDQSAGTDRRLLAAGAGAVSDLLGRLLAEAPPPGSRNPLALDHQAEEQATTVYVVDGDELLSGRNAPARRLLSGAAGPAAGIVLAPTADRLPAVCSDIVILTETGEANLIRPREGGAATMVRPAALAGDLARAASVALAGLDDPELHVPGASLPEVIRLGTLLGVGAWDADMVTARWRAYEGRDSLTAAVGVAEDGPFILDFDRHGPHGLVGGTTGSGKSELLKTLVASLAATYPPAELTFGLFDFKGGATFADFGSLVHTVGIASDLDVNLAKRALRCLRAELVHREMVFDQAGVKDLAELRERRAMGDSMAAQAEALPRLVVIIDEFATMAKELAEEIGAIADLTARGRSLGVHLLLATQKPSTAVNAEIRTNTRLRISLQVEDRQDSLDVVGIPDAAEINHKGRGYFRVGQGEVVPIQTGWSTGKVEVGDRPAAQVVPFGFAATGPPLEPPPRGGTTELQTLVDAIGKAFEASGAPVPRQPWPAPLPEVLSLEELRAVPLDHDRTPDDVYFALADDPDRQARYPVGWPFRSGNLLLYGVVGSGTSTALGSVAVAFARGGPPDRRHLYVLDSGSGDLAPLARLPNCASVVRAADRDLQIQLFAALTRELGRRRSGAAGPPARLPTILVVADNLEALRLAFEDQQAGSYWDEFVRLWSDGPEVGIFTAGSVTRSGGVPSALSSTTPNKLLFRLADVADYANAGIPRAALPTFVPGRALLPDRAQVVQVAMPSPSLAAEVDQLAGNTGPGGPRPVVALRDRVPVTELSGLSACAEERWDLAVGQRDVDGLPATLTLYEGEHAIVAGPARSGKSTALLAVAAALRDAAPAARVLAYGSRRSPLRASNLVERCASSGAELGELADAALVSPVPTLLLVDDVELLGDDDAGMSRLIGSPHPHLRVVAAGKADVLRTLFGHWTQVVRRSRAGLLLQPALDRDGDLLGVRLPYRVHIAMPPGRGFVVCNGEVTMAQVAAG